MEKFEQNNTIQVAIKDEDCHNDVIKSDFPMFRCFICQKGIVTVGKVFEITFPRGSLAGDLVGDIKFYHLTCDRCNFKVLIEENSLFEVIEKMEL